MDILSLPDEMLSIVLKYMRVTELRLLRKTNERVNRLAERANIGKLVPVDHLQHITYLDICNSVHDLPIEIAKKFLHETLSRLETITLTFYGRTTLENICCCEVLGGRNWKRIILRIAVHTQIRLESRFLLEVVPKCETFEFYSNHFTIEEVITLLKKCKSINRVSHEFHFFSLGLGKVRLSDVADLFKNEFDVAYVRHATLGYTTTYEIKIPYNGRIHTLRFQIKEDRI